MGMILLSELIRFDEISYHVHQVLEIYLAYSIRFE